LTWQSHGTLNPDPHRYRYVSGHIFVDETKHRDYLLVAGVVLPADLDTMRKMIRNLILPGQRRLHMKDESASRKRVIAAAITAHDVHAAAAPRRPAETS